jgi:hypothetical protein
MRRQLVSFTDSKLFFVDTTLHVIAHLYALGCFGPGSIEDVLGRDVMVFPLADWAADIPLFAGTDSTKAVSQHRMNQLFKALVLEAGFPAAVTSYSLRSGFVRDMFASGLPTDLVKKLLHHAPMSTDARRHYEGDAINVDVAALRANVQPESPETLDIMEQQYLFADARSLKLSKEETDRVTEEFFATDPSAREAREEYLKLTARIRRIRKKNSGDKRLPELKKDRDRVWDRYGRKLGRRKQKRLNEIKQERMKDTRSNMTMEELDRRKDSSRGPVFTNRLDFVRFLVERDSRCAESSASSDKNGDGFEAAMVGESGDDDDDDDDNDGAEDESEDENVKTEESDEDESDDPSDSDASP